MKTATAWRRAASLVAGTILAALLAFVGSGCSGINASNYFSPLNFFLPSLIQSVSSTPVIPNTANAAPELAQVGYDFLSIQIHPSYLL